MNGESRSCWMDMLHADEVNSAYFAMRGDLPGVVLYCAERPDAPEFDLATIYDVAPDKIDSTLCEIRAWYRARQRRPGIRLIRASQSASWRPHLLQAGFEESAENFTFFSVPPTLHLTPNAAVHVTHVANAAEVALFSTIQVTGFDIPPIHRAWEHELARRHLGTGAYTFYLAWLDGQAVGAARCCHLPGGLTAMAALTTLPAARRHGVGVTLLASMIADSRAHGSHTVFGSVVSGSYAEKRYLSLGFAMHFETTVYFLAPRDAG